MASRSASPTDVSAADSAVDYFYYQMRLALLSACTGALADVASGMTFVPQAASHLGGYQRVQSPVSAGAPITTRIRTTMGAVNAAMSAGAHRLGGAPRHPFSAALAPPREHARSAPK